jgi:hypothetical protein
VVRRAPDQPAPSQCGSIRRTTRVQAAAPLPAGAHRAAFTVPHQPREFGLHVWGQTKQGRFDEFDALVVNGRYLDEVDLYVVGGRLTAQQAAAGCHSAGVARAASAQGVGCRAGR